MELSLPPCFEVPHPQLQGSASADAASQARDCRHPGIAAAAAQRVMPDPLHTSHSNCQPVHQLAWDKPGVIEAHELGNLFCQG